MADIYSLFAGEGPTQEEQARALAAALRGQRGLGQAFMMDPLMANAGKSLLAKAGQSEEILAGAGKQRAEQSFRSLLEQRQAEASMERERFQAQEQMKRLNRELGARAEKGPAAEKWGTVDTNNGLMRFNPRTGELVPLAAPGGTPLLSAATAEKTVAEERKKREQMQEVDARTNTILQNIKLLKEQIGGENGTGSYEMFGPENNIYTARVSDIATDLAKLKDPTSSAMTGEVDREKAALGLEPSFFARNSTQVKVLEELEKAAEARRQEAYRVRGLPLPNNGGPDPREGQTAVPDGLTGPNKAAPLELDAKKKARLEELRRKRDEGKLTL